MIGTNKQRAIQRTKILAGQIRGLQLNIEKDTYCIDLLTQSIAIQKSLGSLNKLILENHLTTHVAEAFRSDDQTAQLQIVEELLKLYELHAIRSAA